MQYPNFYRHPVPSPEKMCKFWKHIPFRSHHKSKSLGEPQRPPPQDKQKQQQQQQQQADSGTSTSDGEYDALTEIAAPEPTRREDRDQDQHATGKDRDRPYLEQTPTGMRDGDDEGFGTDLFSSLSEVRAPEPVQEEDYAARRRPSLEDNLSTASTRRRSE